MKDKNIVIKLIQLLTIIILHHIYGNDSLFLYAITLSLYNIYLSCFSNITLKNILKKNNYDYSKFKILKYVAINIIIVCSIFVVLSIFISDAINISLNINNTFLPYLVMSLSTATEPIIKILLEYLESYNKPKLSNNLLNLYYIIETILILLIGILTTKIVKLPVYLSISMLYLSKIFSFIAIIIIIYITLKKIKINLIKTKDITEINYKKITKEILTNNTHKSTVNITKNSYYYISIIFLYMILSTRYSYDINAIKKDITFIYLYGILIINFVIDITLLLTKKINNKENIINYIYKVFQNILTVTIILSIISPLIYKILFGSAYNSIYLMILSFLSIFIALFNITFDYINNKKIIYISLIIGIITKLILTVPMINSFYRIGYNLVYGDIVSTIISMSISIIINYIYIKANNQKENTLEKILTTLYESILLCIILVLIQFVIPIETDSYLKAIILVIIYISISIMFIKLLKKKRG